MNGRLSSTRTLVEVIQDCGPIGCCCIDEKNAQIIAEAVVDYIRQQTSCQSVRLAGLDPVPMGEPRQLTASHWGRSSVINDEQCAAIFNTMLDAMGLSEVGG